MGIFDDIDRKYRKPTQPPTPTDCCTYCDSTIGLEKCDISPMDGVEVSALLCVPCAAFNVQQVAPRWYWAIGEEPFPDDYDYEWSREEAIRAAKADAQAGDVISLCHCRPMMLDDDIFYGHTDDLLEWWSDQNAEATDSLASTQEQERELAVMLGDTFRKWRLKHRLGEARYPASDAVEVIDLPPD